MICPTCGGKGKLNGAWVAEYIKCWTCRGTGVVTPCTFCKSTGRYTPSGLFNTSKPCPHCDGKGYY